jgi:hypothetical protein
MPGRRLIWMQYVIAGLVVAGSRGARFGWRAFRITWETGRQIVGALTVKLQSTEPASLVELRWYLKKREVGPYGILNSHLSFIHSFIYKLGSGEFLIGPKALVKQFQESWFDYVLSFLLILSTTVSKHPLTISSDIRYHKSPPKPLRKHCGCEVSVTPDATLVLKGS